MEDATDKQHWLLQVKHGFKRLIQEKLFTDVILKVGDQEFECHKNILCVFSSYFGCMFQSGMIESREEVIELGMVEAGPMDLLIQYMYTGMMDMNTHNIARLLWTATFLQMDGFLNWMRQDYNLDDYIHLDNFWDLWCLAESHHDCIFLKDPLINFVLKNFEKLYKTPGFKENMSSEDLLSILNDKSLMVKNEDTVINSVLTWVNHSREKRRVDLTRLIHAVRLPLCQRSSLEQLRSSFRDDMDQAVHDNLKIAEQYQQDCGGQMCFATAQSQYRPYSGKEKVLILINEEKETHPSNEDDICYPSVSFNRKPSISFEPDGMLTVLPYSFRPGGFTTCTYAESCVYLCGYRQQTNAFFYYSTITDKWQCLEPCPGACRVDAHIVAIRDRIYLFGGEEVGKGTLLSAVYVYNVTNNHWDAIPYCHLQIPVTKSLKGCLGDKIYIFGGLSASGDREMRFGEDIVQCIDTTDKSCSIMCCSNLVRGVVSQGCAYSCHADGTVHIIYKESTNSLLIVRFDPESSTKFESIGSIPTTINTFDFSKCNLRMVKQDCNLVVAITETAPLQSALGCIVNFDLKTKTKTKGKLFLHDLEVMEFHFLVLTDEMMNADL
ncbi:kelch repeat and BTB domain-containing protein 2-like [Mizuhopecten yessoensis]|uniref:kelch repeat and BTB domain-containing protein 2-like n=1 Tax=Mizuhopecten yessoensis TaxID=6573 RepID=UPI000B45B86B|nr:kelch repeat and BTB domain-containing protein 2-like [Mizuhopecten yessoensis]